MSKIQPSIILSHPQMGENIGAAARAMLNFGLSDLRLVSPRDGWPNLRATDMSSGALERMPPVQVFETLNDAVADLQVVYATTARGRDMVKPVFTPRSAAEETCARPDIKTGFVFGAERTGLTNDEISVCHNIIHIPTNPEFSSLNLGQAALLVAHELYQAQDNTSDQVFDHGDSVPVERAEFDNFFQRLQGELEHAGFFKSEGLKPTMIRNIRNIFSRIQLSDQEAKTLHGILSALTKGKSG